MVVRRRFQDPVVLGSVYKVGCSECDLRYVGETGRTVQERMMEHRRAARNFDGTSELAVHVAETGHRVDWSGMSVVDKEVDYFKRGFKEAWWSSVHKSRNRTRCEVSDVWLGFSEWF